MASIVEEIRNDREKGAKLLESEYKAGLMSLARRFCSDESDAEELVNRTFAIVVDQIDSYLEQSAFFAWMSRILINCYSKDVRRKSNEMEFCDAELPEDAQDEDASARVFREVDASILRDAIDRLPKDMKQTLLLHYFMDMPVREMAKVLSVLSVAAVGAHSYKWTKNGRAIDGGKDGNLTVEWSKDGSIDTYAVTPVYSVFGEEVEGTAVSVVVENILQGLVIIFQ